MEVRDKNFQYSGGSLKKRFLGSGFHEKRNNNIQGVYLPKKGEIRQFADLRGGFAKKEVLVYLRGLIPQCVLIYTILFVLFLVFPPFFLLFFDLLLTDTFLTWNYSSMVLGNPHYFEQNPVVPIQFVILGSTVPMKGFTNNSGLPICMMLHGSTLSNRLFGVHEGFSGIISNDKNVFIRCLLNKDIYFCSRSQFANSCY